MIGDVDVSKSYGCDKNGARHQIVELPDLILFKDLINVIIFVGISLIMYLNSVFLTPLPIYLFELGFGNDKTIYMFNWNDNFFLIG